MPGLLERSIMGFGHFLRLKGRTSYFRRRIPLALRARLASSEICVRLGVVHKDSAERQARRLAVAVDEFFASAAVDPMLNDDDLKRVVSTTMATWRAHDQRRGAEFVMAWGRRLGTPKEEAALLGEMAQDVLAAQGDGQNMHEPAYVQERFAAVGLPPLEDQIARQKPKTDQPLSGQADAGPWAAGRQSGDLGDRTRRS